MAKKRMAIGRNDTCPCGSGKKYKKCCGVQESQPPSGIQDAFAYHRAEAYSGRIGARRKEFARQYLAHKKTVLTEIESGLAEKLARDNLAISCHKGCAYCCSLYPEASLQECEAIVYYLYHHEDVLRFFLSRYPGWRKKVARAESDYKALTELTEKMHTSPSLTEEQKQLEAARLSYHQHQSPCPFLAEGVCTIHEVRPWACASMVSVTPAAWCNIESADYIRALHYMSDLWLSREMTFFLPIKMELVAVPAPATVFHILKDGFRAWSVIPGLEDIERIWQQGI
jgi:Fe-S-cluster containining protein